MLQPAECVLALAIPVTREAFEADLDPASSKDYAKAFSHTAAGLSADSLWRDYCNVLRTVFETAESVKSLGVVTEEATSLSALERLLSNFSVVTLVAHWRGAAFFDSDFLDPASVAADLLDGTREELNPLRSSLAQDDLSVLRAAGDPAELCTGLRKAFNHLLVQQVLWDQGVPSPIFPGGVKKDIALTPLQLAFLNRHAIDTLFSDDRLRPGNRLELADDMWSIDDIVEAIPASFEGVFDLTVCNSVLLGDTIKRSRPDCLVAMHEERVGPIVRFVIYRNVMAFIARTGAEYETVLIQVLKELCD